MKRNMVYRYKNYSEVIANRHVLKTMTVATIIAFVVVLLNFLKVFTVDTHIIIQTFTVCVVVYALTMLVFVFGDISQPWVKYYILFGEVVWITVVSTGLTYHTVLMCSIPLISAAAYTQKKMTLYTYLLLVVSTIISVFVGYQYGVCDINMVALSGESMDFHLVENFEVVAGPINDTLLYALTCFYVVPRCMILFAIAMTTSNVSKIISFNMEYAKEMKNKAERDEMTGLYNRSKYISMMSERYLKEDKIGVIFWDINFLKRTNDSLGHEKGDQLIKLVSESILMHVTPNSLAYRIGGDEFIMVLTGAEDKDVQKKLKDWKKTIEKYEKDTDLKLSVSVGYASGRGEDFDILIKDADKRMYDEKLLAHTDAVM